MPHPWRLLRVLLLLHPLMMSLLRRRHLLARHK
jgi:hypothetical protein